VAVGLAPCRKRAANAARSVPQTPNAVRGSVVVTGDDMGRWLREMEAEGVGASRNTLPSLAVLLPVVAAVGKVSASQARTIVQQAKALGSTPSLQGYNQLLTATARACRHGAGSLADAGLVLQHMDADKVGINTFTFNALLDVLAAAAAQPHTEVCMTDVTEVIHRLQDEGVAADTVTLNSALGVVLALARHRSPRGSSRNARDMLHVFEELGVAPNAISYTLYLEVMAEEAANGLAGLDDAEAVLREMSVRGLAPSKIAWNVVMSVVARSAARHASAMATADAVLERMAAAGFSPDSFTITSYCYCARLAKIEAADGDEFSAARDGRLQGTRPAAADGDDLAGYGRGVGGRARAGGGLVWDDDDAVDGRRARRDVLAEASLSLVDGEQLGVSGRKVEAFGFVDEAESLEDGFWFERPYFDSYLDSDSFESARFR